MCLLILGGTADGRKLAEYFHQHNVPVIYSVAGLVRQPQVDCQVVSGGFRQFGGLEEFIQQHAVAAVLDVTHPYAAKMSATAMQAAAICDIPCWRFPRQAWQASAADNWQLFSDFSAMLPCLSPFKRVLFTCGQLSADQLTAVARFTQQQSWLRTAVQPKYGLAENMQWIKAIGPFDYADELALMQRYNIDVLVSKNSGGDSTSAKLAAARDMAIPVLMLERPEIKAADAMFESLTACQQYVLEKFSDVR